METINMNGNNLTNGNNKPFPTKSRSNFSQAAVKKSDVGDFQEGYFVMAEMPHRPKNTNHHNNYKTQHVQERHTTEKRNHRPPQQPHRARSTNDMDSTSHQQREGDINVSSGRLPTSPHRSPNRKQRNSNSPPQVQYSQSSQDLSSLSSPQKPQKAPVSESGSPKEKRSSPPTNRWAGPAFSNAPPPSSLPLPDFPPFLPSSTSTTSPLSSPSSSPSSSPPSSSFLAPAVPIYIQPPLFTHQPFVPPHANVYFDYRVAYPEFPPQGIPTLSQLSTDLRRMLNISAEQPVNA